jgi:hypothetical protein
MSSMRRGGLTLPTRACPETECHPGAEHPGLGLVGHHLLVNQSLTTLLDEVDLSSLALHDHPDTAKWVHSLLSSPSVVGVMAQNGTTRVLRLHVR